MLLILEKAVNYLLAFVLRLSPIKFVVMLVLYLIFTVLMDMVFSLFPNWFSLNGVLNSIPTGAWWFLDMIGFDYGAPLIIGAWVTRFLIRRIPFVG